MTNGPDGVVEVEEFEGPILIVMGSAQRIWVFPQGAGRHLDDQLNLEQACRCRMTELRTRFRFRRDIPDETGDDLVGARSSSADDATHLHPDRADGDDLRRQAPGVRCERESTWGLDDRHPVPEVPLLA